MGSMQERMVWRHHSSRNLPAAVDWHAVFVALAPVLQLLPQTLIDPTAGVVNDRLRRKHVMIAGGPVRFVVVLAMLFGRLPPFYNVSPSHTRLRLKRPIREGPMTTHYLFYGSQTVSAIWFKFVNECCMDPLTSQSCKRNFLRIFLVNRLPMKILMSSYVTSSRGSAMC